MIDINALEGLLVTLAAEHGVSLESMQDSWNEATEDLDWKMNYKKDLNARLQDDIRGLVGYAGVCEMARRDGDLLAIRVALIRLRIYAMNVGQTFDALAEDVAHIALLEYDRPGRAEMPERYTFSERYREAFPDLKFDV